MLKNLDDINKFQKDCREEMRNKISSFEEETREYWNEVLDTVYGQEEEDTE